MRHNILPLVMTAPMLLASPATAQEPLRVPMPAEDTAPPPKAMVDILLTINTYHLHEVFQTTEKIKQQTQEQIQTMLQNSGLAEYAAFNIVGVHTYSVPNATAREIGIAKRLRDEYQADLVLDFGSIKRYGIGGQAFTTGMYGEFMLGNNPNPQEDAYLLEVDELDTYDINAGVNYTIAHELAHLLGCGHCNTQSTQPWHGLYTFAAGAVDAKNSAVTLMTYENKNQHTKYQQGFYRNLNVLSSPQPYVKDGITYNTGNAETDNKRCFLMTLPMVAGYRAGSATTVLNDTPLHAFELPPLYPLSYYTARFAQCSNDRILQLLLAYTEHTPHMLRNNYYTRVWGSTANATPDTTPGNTPNVWYRITAPHTATYTVGFRSGCGPAHTCRIFRKEGQELVALPADCAQGELRFRAEQGDELYVEIAALQEGGVFNLYLASDHAVKPLPEFKDVFEIDRWSENYATGAFDYAILNADPTDLQNLLQVADISELLSTDYASELLYRAAALGYTEHCRLLLAAGAKATDDEDKISPLIIAIAAGQESTATLLQEAGASRADLTNREKLSSILHILSSHKCSDALRRLIDAGMPVDMPLSRGSGIRITKEKKFNSKEDTPKKEDHLLHLAAALGRADLVNYLLENGAAVDAVSTDNITALHYAAEQGHAECLKLLLAAGATPNASAKDAETTPPGAAATQGHIECVRLLLEAGADTAAAKHKKLSPLMQAIETGNTACMELLLNATPDLLAATQTGYTALMAAASLPTPDLLNKLLAQGADANARALSGKTALLQAAQHGRAENMRLLLEHGAQVNTQDNDGDTPLLMTTLHGNTECTKLLLAHGADVTIANKAKFTPLMQAARNGNTECVKLLLQAGAKDTYTRRQRTTSLMLAASKGSADCIRLLLEAGSKVNARDDDRMAALSYATQYGNPECVQLLIDAGAKVLIRDSRGHSPLMLAVQKGHTDCARLLLQHGAAATDANDSAESVLMQAAKAGHADCVKLLLETGTPVSATTPGGETALSLALKYNHAECVKLLLAAGANPNQKNKNQAPLIHNVIENIDPQCLQLLCEAGANIDIADESGMTPLMYAASYGSEDNVRLLLQHGANVNHVAAQSDGDTAIFHATETDSPGIFKLLMQAGANLNHQNANGVNLLHIAIKEQAYEIAQLLIEHGISIEATDANGLTPLHYATLYGNTLDIKWLLAQGADINTITAEGDNLFLSAAKNDNVDVLKLLIAKGQNPHHVNILQKTALHHAAKAVNTNVVEYLLELGLNPNATDKDGLTPLMESVKRYATNIPEILIKNGADIHAKDAQGRTALHHAAIEEKNFMYRELIKLGADPEARDNNGQTPFEIVKEQQKKREDERYEKGEIEDPVGELMKGSKIRL